MVGVSFTRTVRGSMGTAALPARRPSAGPVRGLLGGKDLTGRLFFSFNPSRFWTYAAAPHGSRQRDHFAAGARAQGLERWQWRPLAQEAHGAVGEGKVCASRMAAAEGAGPILQRGEISPGRHPVVDRHGGVERDAPIGRRVRDEPPLPPAGGVTCCGPNYGPAAVKFRIMMDALAEEERVASPVGDV